MLILSRKLNESITISDNIEITIVDIKGDQVKLGIKAPRDIKIYRMEVYREIQKENIAAARSNPEKIPELKNVFENPDRETK